MPLWEYCKINLSLLPRGKDDIDLLNEVGAQGWRLVTILPSTNVAFLIRKLEERASASVTQDKKARAK